MPGVGYLSAVRVTAVGSPRTAYAVAGGRALLLVLAAAVMLRQMRLGRPRRRDEDLPHAIPGSSLSPPVDPHEVVVDVGER